MVRHVIKVDCGGLLLEKLDAFHPDLSELVLAASFCFTFVISGQFDTRVAFSASWKILRRSFVRYGGALDLVDAALLHRFVHLRCDNLV